MRFVSPYPSLGKISFTKFTSPEGVTDVLRDVVPGQTTAADVLSALASAGQPDPLWNDLLAYEPAVQKENEPAGSQVVVDNELLRACREEREDRLLLLWVALNLADPRLDDIVRHILTDQEGHLRPAVVNGPELAKALERRAEAGHDTPHDTKSTSNILSLLERCRLIVPTKHAKTIIGIDTTLSTRHAVRGAVRLIRERLADRAFEALPEQEVHLALSIGANAWLNLSPEEFEAAYYNPDRNGAQPQSVRGDLPDDLMELATQLRRKGQVVLQGPPGAGKTFVAKRYIDWVTAHRSDDSRLQAIVDALPENERGVAGLADEVVRRGLASLWDIVQFHPGYDYTDFVRALVAQPHGEGVTFVAQHRILSLMAAVGRELDSRGYGIELVLVLDEINRGDIPNIFGELLYGLEYRGEAVATPYSVGGEASLTIPANLRVIGTMNTADRSIAVIDYALRRRFVFLDVAATETPILSFEFDNQLAKNAALYLYRATADALSGAPAGLQVGPSYFLAGADDGETSLDALSSRYVYEVLPLLGEYEMEGEVDLGSINGMRKSLGMADDATQREQVAALKSHLESQPWVTAPFAAPVSTPEPTDGP